MALHPGDLTTNEIMQPGSHGEIFRVNQPGYRDDADRVNRTNNNLNTSDHDVPNIKYLLDPRLPALFKYGFGHGFNQIVVPKGRIVATDPHMDLVDFESQKEFNVVTLANGGAPVKLRENSDNYPTFTPNPAIVSASAQGHRVLGVGKEWNPIAGLNATYSNLCYRPFASTQNLTAAAVTLKSGEDHLTTANLKVDEKTGKILDTATHKLRNDVRPGNLPIGMLERNEYTRNDDAYNGMAVGPILTDALVELAWFAYKDKAEQNFWGSAYGALFPGARVKSDENGRITISPLSFPKVVEKMSLAEYELERQQEIGQVYSVNHDLVPEGAAKWATWALEDRLNSEEFNPAVYAKTNRKGEDAVNSSPFNSTGRYPGYPFEKNYLNNDLHMLASTARLNTFDPRMNPEFQYNDLGIPGLTDGHNAVIRDMPEFSAGNIFYCGDGKEYVDWFFRIPDVNVENLEINVNNGGWVSCVQGASIATDAFEVKYSSMEQGIITLAVKDKSKADAILKPAGKNGVAVKFKYKKRGMSGVPTFMDWDGAIGSVKILLTK